MLKGRSPAFNQIAFWGQFKIDGRKRRKQRAYPLYTAGFPLLRAGKPIVGITDVKPLRRQGGGAVKIEKLLRTPPLRPVGELHAPLLQLCLFVFGEQSVLPYPLRENALVCTEQIDIFRSARHRFGRRRDRDLVHRGRDLSDIRLRKNDRKHLRKLCGLRRRLTRGHDKLVERSAEHVPKLNGLGRRGHVAALLFRLRPRRQRLRNTEPRKKIEKQRRALPHGMNGALCGRERFQRRNHPPADIRKHGKLRLIRRGKRRAVSARIHIPRVVARKHPAADIPLLYVIFK